MMLVMSSFAYAQRSRRYLGNDTQGTRGRCHTTLDMPETIAVTTQLLANLCVRKAVPAAVHDVQMAASETSEREKALDWAHTPRT